MTITDEKISAFLDAELPAAEMAHMRELIATDEHIAARVEAFAIVDATLLTTYGSINDQPIPEPIKALLQQDTAVPETLVPVTGITTVSGWRKLAANALKPAAVAACLTFVMGYGLATLYSPGNPTQGGVAVSYQQLLSHVPSGEQVAVDDTVSLRVNLSFDNQQGQHCRQYTEQSVTAASDNIVCYRANQWQLIARHPLSVQSASLYGTAAGPEAIDRVIDQMIAGPVKTPAEEKTLIARSWQAAQNH